MPSDNEYNLFSVKSILDELSELFTIMFILKNIMILNRIDNLIRLFILRLLINFILSSVSFFNLN